MRIKLTYVLPLRLLAAKDRPQIIIRIGADSLKAEVSAPVRQVRDDTVRAAVFEVYDCSAKRLMVSVLDNAEQVSLHLLCMESMHPKAHAAQAVNSDRRGCRSLKDQAASFPEC